VRMSLINVRPVRFLALLLLLAGAIGIASPEPVLAALPPASLAASFTINGSLSGVAATSAGNAWAVGSFTAGKGFTRTLIVHWSGTAWKQVPSPGPLGSSLKGVAALSARSAWAVGSSGTHALIERWNGTTWKQVPSPSSADSSLSGVAAISADDAWAVGHSFTRRLIQSSFCRNTVRRRLRSSGRKWSEASCSRCA
jgi:hypothetical protein